MAKNRTRKEKKGHGYRPRSQSTTVEHSATFTRTPVTKFLSIDGKNKYVVIGSSVVVLLLIAFGIYYYGFSSGKMTSTASGLKYQDEVVGTGASPTQGSQVTVHYTGTLADGTKFDSSVDRGVPYTFPIGAGEVVKGWDEGIMSMKVGGKRKLVIPPQLGYGSTARQSIPANSTMYFDVELLNVK